MTNNNLINTSVQKGCKGKVPGCWEHISIMWSTLKEAQYTKSSLANIWLNIANAYGSIVVFCFRMLRRWSPLDFPYQNILFRNLYGSFSESAPSSWHQHFKGISAWYTLSIIHFLAGSNVVIEYTLASSACKFMSTGNVTFLLVRAFLDDLNLMSSSVSGTQNLLHRCAEALSWAGMYFRGDHSRSIAIVRGKSMNTTLFYVTTIDYLRFHKLHPFDTCSASKISWFSNRWKLNWWTWTKIGSRS